MQNAECRKQECTAGTVLHSACCILHLRHFTFGSFTRFLNTSSNRSPTFASRLGIVRMLYFSGSSFFVTSLHLSGAETGAPSIARGEYGATTVLPYAFC